MTVFEFEFKPPDLQIEFALKLAEIRETHLQSALLKTVRKMKVSDIDKELSELAPQEDLAILAAKGLRGEILFPVPVVLRENPRLLGYYRLLMGFSQKDFYGKGKGFNAGQFKSMELKGVIGKKAEENLFALCRAFGKSGSLLLKGLELSYLNKDLLDDLTLLSLGPQLRGGENNRLGVLGIQEVFELIRVIVVHYIAKEETNGIMVLGPAGRGVRIAVASDPDIVIQDEMAGGKTRKMLAIEVKSGRDESNIHNRIGEAEKSHQKARKEGFVECWTVVNVSKLDIAKARSESPSTDQFYSLSELKNKEGTAYRDFQSRILSLASLPEL